MANEIIPETGDKTAGRKEPETKSRIWSKHPCPTLALLTPLAGIVVVVLWTLAVERDLDDLLELIMLGSLGAGCLVFPWIITAAEIYLAIRGHGHEETYRRGRGFDVAAIPLGVLYSIIYLEVFYSVEFGKTGMRSCTTPRPTRPFLPTMPPPYGYWLWWDTSAI